MKEYSDPLQQNTRVRRRRRDESWLRNILWFCLLFTFVLHFAGYVILREMDSWGRKVVGYDQSGRPIYEGEAKIMSPLQTQILSQAQFERLLVQSQRAAVTERRANEQSRFTGEQTQRVERETVNPRQGDPNATGDRDQLGTGDAQGRRPSPKPSPEEGMAQIRNERVVPGAGILNPRSPKNAKFRITEEGTGRLEEGDKANVRAKGSRDRLPKDIAIGVDTLLNTDEYIYASFFNRLKSEVGPRWEPLIQRVLDDPRHRMAEGEYVTETRFVCDRAGNIESVEITRRSGVTLFDEAAEQALLQTRRVSNPPAAFLELDGRYRFKLGFSVQVSRGGLQLNYIPDPRF